jgi:hypothetical protein
MYTLQYFKRSYAMTKDEALKIAMHALINAAWDLFDNKTLQEALEDKTLREIHTAIQAIKKARANA